MKKARIFHAIGAWALILMGLAHETAHVHFKLADHTPEEQRVLDAMRSLPIAGPGSVTQADILEGFSISFSLFAVMIGVLALVVGRRAAARPEVLQPFRIAVILFLLIETVVSVTYFIPPPTVFLSVSILAFFASWVTSRGGPPATA